MIDKQKDILNDVGHLALGSRLKRLSDRIMSDAAKTYAEFGFDIEPSTFPILASLDRLESLGIVEMASLIGVKQPTISRAVNDLEKRGFLKRRFEKNDRRKCHIELSVKGKLLVERLRTTMWPVVRSATMDLCVVGNDDFLDRVRQLESQLDNKSLYQRAMEKKAEHERGTPVD